MCMVDANWISGTKGVQGRNPFARQEFIEPAAEGEMGGEAGAVYEKVAEATRLREGRVEWWRMVEVVPIQYEVGRIYTSERGTVSRVGEIWVRIRYLGIRVGFEVWFHRVKGETWVTEPQVGNKERGFYDVLHFDAMEDRRGMKDWLAAVWTKALVDSGGFLPYSKGHVRSRDGYFPVDADGQIGPNRRGELPWQRWEQSSLGEERRATGATPKTVGGGRAGESGGDGARRGGDGHGAPRRTDVDAVGHGTVGGDPEGVPGSVRSGESGEDDGRVPEREEARD